MHIAPEKLIVSLQALHKASRRYDSCPFLLRVDLRHAKDLAGQSSEPSYGESALPCCASKCKLTKGLKNKVEKKTLIL